MKKNTILAATVALLIASPSLVYAQQDSILEDSYITTQEFVEAEVVRIKRADRLLVVRGNNQGKVREFFVPKGAFITIKGKEAKFRDIRKGDQVSISMTPKHERVQITRIKVPETTMPLEVRQANPVTQTLPAVLPQTASSWFGVLGLGVISLFAAAFVRKIRK